MKPFIFICILCSSLSLTAQQNADAILGKWLKVPKKDLVIEVFKEAGEYNGRITWSKDDTGKKPEGFLILENLQYNAEKHAWENGKVRDPSSGSTYRATAKIDSAGTLEVHGYKGMKFLGTTKYFQKVE